jgi:hypothetical protein
VSVLYHWLLLLFDILRALEKSKKRIVETVLVLVHHTFLFCFSRISKGFRVTIRLCPSIPPSLHPFLKSDGKF